MRQVVLCPDCGVYPAIGTNLKKMRPCMQCQYGVGKATDGEKPLTKTEQAHTLLSQAVANGKASGVEALAYWDQWKNRPKQPFFPRRKAQEETPEEKRARLEAIAREVRKMYPEKFAQG